MRPLDEEMLRRFPSVRFSSYRLSLLHDDCCDHNLPLWLAEFARIPYFLVSLVHLCRRVGKTRDDPDVWRALRKDSCTLLQALMGPLVSLSVGDPTLALVEYAHTVGDQRILGRVIGCFSLEELETSLPCFSDEDSVAHESDNSMRCLYDRTREFPFDCWAPYGGFAMSEEDK